MKKIIVFDGPSACGKTTLLERVHSEMNKKGLRVDIMTERNTIRDLIDKLQMGNVIRSGLPPLTESLFWTMNQAYRVETELSEKQGDIVLVDRYIYTPITYQYLFLRGGRSNTRRSLRLYLKTVWNSFANSRSFFGLNCPIKYIKTKI